MSDERIKEIEARAEKATSGPWAWATGEASPVYIQLYATDDAVDEYEADILSSDSSGVLVVETNADFIAHSREDVPYLLAQVAVLEMKLAVCESALNSSAELTGEIVKQRDKLEKERNAAQGTARVADREWGTCNAERMELCSRVEALQAENARLNDFIGRMPQ